MHTKLKLNPGSESETLMRVRRDTSVYALPVPAYYPKQNPTRREHKFKANLKWHDGYEGHGEHYFDYNHVDPKAPVHHAPAYAPPKPAYGGPTLTNKVCTKYYNTWMEYMFKFQREAEQSIDKRVRRDTPGYGPPVPAYHAPAPYHAPKAHGRVGPIYTFVKTDPQANFKWGVRHRAGAQYGKQIRINLL